MSTVTLPEHDARPEHESNPEQDTLLQHGRDPDKESAESTSTVDPAFLKDRLGAIPRSWMGIIAALFLASLPLLYTYASWTWSDGHYQYMPLLLAFVAFLYFRRFPAAGVQRSEPKPLVVLAGLLTVGLLLAIGNLLYSGFIGIITATASACLLTYALLGFGGLKNLSPVLALCLLAIPLPLGLDKSLIFQMQFLASHLATLLLDGAGVMHVRNGVILITEQSQYMTEEACSGVRSLFSSLAVVSCYSVAARHWWPRVTTNLLQSVVWVLIGNAIRVALTVYLADNVSSWFASGLGHEVLSIMIFAFILAMIVSTDHLLTFFLRSQFGLTWDRDDQSGKFADETTSPQFKSQQTVLPESNAGDVGIRFPSLSTPVTVGVLVMLGLVTLLGARVAYINSGRGLTLLSSVPRLEAPRQQDLPEVLAAWRQVGFEHIQRERSSLFASDSYVWSFRRGPLAAIVSLDCPWAEWHNLQRCYSAVGWQCEMQTMLKMGNEASTSDMTHSEINLSKRGNKTGMVIFGSIDAKGQDVKPQWRHRDGIDRGLLTSLTSQAALSLGLGAERQFEIEGLALPATTIQLYSENSVAYTDADREAIRSLYQAARTELLKSKRWQN